jgi:hypothetical protein
VAIPSRHHHDLRGSRDRAVSPVNDREIAAPTMPELMVDFITSLDGYGAAEGWPGW